MKGGVKVQKPKKKIMGRAGLTIRLTFILLGIIILSALIIGIAYYFTGYIFKTKPDILPIFLVLIVVGESILISACILVPLSFKYIISPVNKLLRGLNDVAEGDYSKRIKTDGKGTFGAVYDNFNKMAQVLQDTETLSTDFVHNFSHEFKTPIVSIQGFARLLKNPNLSQSERAEYLDIILDECKRLVDLSTNSLILTKLETQEPATYTEEYSLDEQIRQCVLQYENVWALKKLDIDIDMQEIFTVGNSDLTRQLWGNLISNAIKFSDDQQKVSINLARKDNEAVFSITNFGSGISEQALPHIFDKYYQEDASRLTEGNGLGLAIVKRIVTITGGKIDVTSNKECGTTFTVHLPIKLAKAV